MYCKLAKSKENIGPCILQLSLCLHKLEKYQMDRDAFEFRMSLQTCGHCLRTTGFSSFVYGAFGCVDGRISSVFISVLAHKA
jgi:hypothetical protein